MVMPTGSGLDRAENCPPSCALPQIATENEDAERGTARHTYLQHVPTMGAKAIEMVPEKHQAECKAIELDGLPLDPEVYQQEVTYAFNLKTRQARVLGTGLKRDYSSAGPDDVVGTIDVVGALEDGAANLILDIPDYKAEGFSPTVLPPAKNPQLLLAARCASLVTEIPDARVRLIHLRADGTHWEESAMVGALDLDIFEERLVRIIEGVRRAELDVARGLTPNVSQGRWCKFCPAAAACPAVLGLIRAAALEPERALDIQPGATVDDLVRAITPATAATAYERMRRVEAALKMAKSALYTYAQEHPFEVGEGYAYGPSRYEAKDYDGRITRSVVLEVHGPDAADAAVEYSTSEAAIERGVRPTWEKQLAEYEVARDAAKAAGKKLKDLGLVKPTLTGLKKDVIEKVRALGGVKTELKTKTTEYKVASGTGVLKATPLPEKRAPAPELPPAEPFKTCPAHGQYRGDTCPACAAMPPPEPEPTYATTAVAISETGRTCRIVEPVDQPQ